MDEEYFDERTRLWVRGDLGPEATLAQVARFVEGLSLICSLAPLLERHPAEGGFEPEPYDDPYGMLNEPEMILRREEPLQLRQLTNGNDWTYWPYEDTRLLTRAVPAPVAVEMLTYRNPFDALVSMVVGGHGILSMLKWLIDRPSQKRLREAETKRTLAEADRFAAESDKLRAEAERARAEADHKRVETAMLLRQYEVEARPGTRWSAAHLAMLLDEQDGQAIMTVADGLRGVQELPPDRPWKPPY